MPPPSDVCGVGLDGFVVPLIVLGIGGSLSPQSVAIAPPATVNPIANAPVTQRSAFPIDALPDDKLSSAPEVASDGPGLDGD
jgi:hypothetical protein